MEPMNRRDLLTSAAAFALLAVEADPKAFAQAVQESPTNGAVDIADYWTKFYDDTVGQKGPNGAPLAKKDRKTIYLHSPADNDPLVASGKLPAGLTYAETLKPAVVCQPIKGDVQVKMAISQYRPGSGDVSQDVTHLRIDTTQTFDYMNIVAPLSWATIASLTPSTSINKIPTLDQLGFHAESSAPTNPSNLKQLVLPNGVGKFAVNITRPSNPQATQIISATSAVVNGFMSIMVVPAISVPAVKVFTALLGKWLSHATVIANGNLTPVIATSVDPPVDVLPQQPMPLRSGYYVMFPKQHQDELTASFDRLTMLNGFLVYKDAPASQDLETQAAAAVPGVSYATLRVYVDPATQAGCSTKPVNNSASGD